MIPSGTVIAISSGIQTGHIYDESILDLMMLDLRIQNSKTTVVLEKTHRSGTGQQMEPEMQSMREEMEKK